MDDIQIEVPEREDILDFRTTSSHLTKNDLGCDRCVDDVLGPLRSPTCSILF